MNCGYKEKTILLFYGELPYEQEQEVRAHVKSCQDCNNTFAALKTFSEKVSSLSISPGIENTVLSYAGTKSYQAFSMTEKILAAALSLAMALLFINPFNAGRASSFSWDNEAGIDSLESEISAVKYDMVDFSDSQLEYRVSISRVEAIEGVFQEEK